MHLPTTKKNLVACLAILMAIAATYPAALNATTVAGTPSARTLVAEAITAPANNLVIKEPQAIDIWIAKLVYQESHGRNDLKILDVNGQYSYGCLQFQEGTFRAYGLKYGLISRDTDIEPAIYDCDLQKKIAKAMLADDYSNWRAWYTSSKNSLVGLPPKAS